MFQVSKMSLTTFLAQLVSNLWVKLWKVVKRGKICFLSFGHLFSKCTFLMLWTFFFLPSGCPVNSIFQWQYVFIRFMFLMKHFFLLTIRMAMFTKLFSVVTCCEELSPINHSVYWNINPPPPSETPSPSFLPSPPLKLANCPRSPF